MNILRTTLGLALILAVAACASPQNQADSKADTDTKKEVVKKEVSKTDTPAKQTAEKSKSPSDDEIIALSLTKAQNSSDDSLREYNQRLHDRNQTVYHLNGVYTNDPYWHIRNTP